MERSADWLDQARGDLDHARSDVERGYFDWACFSAQQSAEKAVKAVLQWMGAEAWGRSAADLLAEVGQAHGVSDDLIDAALELDKAYIPTRYPDVHPSGSPRRRYTRIEAQRLVQHAEAVVQFCEDLIPTLSP